MKLIAALVGVFFIISTSNAKDLSIFDFGKGTVVKIAAFDLPLIAESGNGVFLDNNTPKKEGTEEGCFIEVRDKSLKVLKKEASQKANCEVTEFEPGGLKRVFWNFNPECPISTISCDSNKQMLQFKSASKHFSKWFQFSVPQPAGQQCEPNK